MAVFLVWASKAAAAVPLTMMAQTLVYRRGGQQGFMGALEQHGNLSRTGPVYNPCLLG